MPLGPGNFSPGGEFGAYRPIPKSVHVVLLRLGHAAMDPEDPSQDEYLYALERATPAQVRLAMRRALATKGGKR